MPSKRKLGCLSVAALAVLAVVIAFFAHQWVYYEEFRPMRDAAQGQGFEVRSSWEYDEDLTLEDFGIYIVKGDLSLWVDVRNGSDVRKPDSPITGIALQSLHEGWRENERIFYFDSDFWLEHGLPKISTPREFFAHASTIWPLLLKSKGRFRREKSQYHTSHYRKLLVLRDDPPSLSPLWDKR